MSERYVIDIGVLVSALIGKRGPARAVLRQGLQGQFIPLISNPLLQEYESLAFRPRILSRCPLTEGEIRELLNAWYGCCEWVPIYFLWRPNLPDENDNFLFELALAGNARGIVTQNTRNLSPEPAFPDIRIFTPSQFLRVEASK
jgi:putative PIN family toxin of toxin-antitoxin system